MNRGPSVLLLGGTGKTGRQVLPLLLDAGASVRVIVRSASRLPSEVTHHPALDVVVADLANLPDDEWRRHLVGRDSVISCLGHTTSLRGIFGPPRDLVTGAVAAVVRAARETERDAPLRLVVLSSVSVHRPLPADALRGRAERAYLNLLASLVPPALDNQRAANMLENEVGSGDPHVFWVAVRPDGLVGGEETEYVVADQLTRSVFRPTTTRRANVASFMTRLVADDATWNRWQGGMPVLEDAPDASGSAGW